MIVISLSSLVIRQASEDDQPQDCSAVGQINQLSGTREVVHAEPMDK